MKKTPLEKVIELIREQAIGGAPTNNVGSGNIAGTSQAGDDPPIRKKKRYIYTRGARKQWMKK
jgi:hypothetical protein|tara:strand:- start:1979 stop:2167 length:189 start_codon:yes stop_codon:yes gene_type:complete